MKSSDAVLLLLLALLFGLVAALDRPRAARIGERVESIKYPSQFLQQLVDHRSSNNATFRQRFFAVLDSWKAPDGPFILAVGGEGTQDTPYGVNDEAAVIAKQTNAAVLTLEHRFFGNSLVFDDLSVDHLKLLTVEQELEDLAYFLRFYQARINAQYGKTTRNKVLVLGGSYAGMIASHMRFAHPELVDAAWSSSGVVDAIFNFSSFDLQVAVSLGQVCAELVRRAGEEVEAMLRIDNVRTKALFGATGMSDDDLLWMLSDASTLPPQYGRAASLCDPMVAAHEAGRSLAVAFAQFCNASFYPGYCAGVGPYLYSDELMLNLTAKEDWSAQRAWWWMVCNELSYAQSYPGELGVRSSRIDLAFHKKKCDTVYGRGIWPPNTEAFNAKYGGKHPKAKNVFYINASQDPWQWAGVRRTLSASQPAYLMTGHEVGHCKDLHGESTTDPIDVKAGRKVGEAFVRALLK